MKSIIVDDEPLALDLLEDNLARISFVDNLARCKNAFEAIEAISTMHPDLVFLDIQMPGLDGLSFLKTLPNPPMVVFVTAHKQYSLESYELNVLDYLVKPVSFERFLKACTKAQHLYQLQKRAAQNTSPEPRDFMMIHIDYNLVKVTFRDILFIEGLKDYVKIFLAKEPKPLITRLNLKAVEDQLPLAQFARVHRSYLVALDKIETLNKKSLCIGGHELPIGDLAWERLQTYFHLK